jgi:hypothetical protein
MARSTRPIWVAALAVGICSLASSPVRADKPLARANRLAISLSFGLGSASLGSYHDGVDAVRELAERQNGVKLSDPTSNLQIGAEIGLRYYFPYHLLAHVGFATLYNWGSGDSPLLANSLDNHNLVMEVPILVGGYYVLIDRLYLFGAIGPTILFHGRSWWDPGPDYKAGGGVGMQVQLGADFMIGEFAAIGLDLRYRLMNAGGLKEKDTGTDMTPQLLGKSGSEPYELDFSGISVALNLRLFIL